MAKKAKVKKAKAPAVHCSYDKLVAVDKLTEHPENPNIHSAEQVELLAAIIKVHGWRLPITVSNLSKYVIMGHCRLKAAKLLGLDKVPVDYQDYKNKEQEKAVLVADNHIAELAEIDGQKMSELLLSLDKAKYDLGYTALSAEHIESYILGTTDFIDKLESEGDTVAVDNMQQITFILKRRNMGMLLKRLASYDKDKNKAIIKWLRNS